MAPDLTERVDEPVPGALKGRSALGRAAAAPFVLAIRLYQATLSPLMGGLCRFHPTCSEYGLDAFRAHNPLRATVLTARRILRCHPWGGSGYDPVPIGTRHEAPPPEARKSTPRH